MVSVGRPASVVRWRRRWLMEPSWQGRTIGYGSCLGKPGFEDHCRGFGIDGGCVLASLQACGALACESPRGLLRSMAFIGELHRQLPALGKRCSESARSTRHGLLLALAIERQAHDVSFGKPFPAQGIEPDPVGLAFANGDGGNAAGSGG